MIDILPLPDVKSKNLFSFFAYDLSTVSTLPTFADYLTSNFNVNGNTDISSFKKVAKQSNTELMKQLIKINSNRYK